MSDKHHWDTAYLARDTQDLGWYEENPGPSIDLMEITGVDPQARILNVGAGSSTFIDYLISEGYQNIIVNDLSSKAIEQLKERLGEHASRIESIEDDLTAPELLNNIDPVDVWHDRAVLHFFLKEEEKSSYFDLLKKLVKPGGYVIIAEFSLDGATKCCNLDLCQWNEEMISERLGSSFSLLKSFNYTFKNPRGEDRPYIYTLYRRND